MPEHQKMSNALARLFPCLILALCLLGVRPAYAIDYEIEIVLFENTSQTGQFSTPELYHPRTNEALQLGSDTAAAAGFVLVNNELTLGEQADSLDSSRSYRVLEHFAWRQPGLDDASAKSIRISSGQAFRHYIPSNFRDFENTIPATAAPSPGADDRQITSTEVNGTVKIRLGRFLHLDANLVFTDIESGHSFRLNHSRKMRSRELHYIDNPRFGFLARILPVPDS